MSSALGVPLPDLWSTAPLKHVSTVLSRGSAPNYVDSGSVRTISQAANQANGVDWSRTRFHDFDGDPTGLKGYLRPNDILINSTGTGTLGRVGFFSEAPDHLPCMADSHVTIARANSDELDARFAYYWLSSRPFQEFVYAALAVGATNQIELNRDRLGSAPVPLPPAQEQRRIANYLDVETEKIDDLVTKKRHLVALMNERIDSRVLQHVGESQLTDAPSGTALVPIRRVLKKVFRPALNYVGIVTAFRDGQVTDRALRRAEGYTMSASSDPQGQNVQINDVVVHGLDGFAGAIGTAEAIGNCSPVYHVCVPKHNGDARYLGRLLRLLALQGYLGNFATSTRERAVDFRNWEIFGRIPIPSVPDAEQQEVGHWITQVRPLHEAIERSAALAAERRQALITAAVTGQFDVSTASGRNVTDGVPTA
ncbi:restriction endonuclease subunit S [Streptomyces sp. BE230]|uniref:restriction endonuclease subunit S n=1 Tax=Streptomyces sp. BE230 TaxID=3002526 RepID=UPI002ED6914C|nr:restriction endonuclease subunit S [Streptomyces sp. BE230]